MFYFSVPTRHGCLLRFMCLQYVATVFLESPRLVLIRCSTDPEFGVLPEIVRAVEELEWWFVAASQSFA